MRLIHIDDYDERTMKLAKPVYDSQRRVLLSAEHRIHPKYLIRLKELGIRYLMVEDEASQGITMEEMLDMPTWMDLIEVVRQFYQVAAEKKRLPLKELLAATGKLLEELRHRPVLVPIPTAALAAEWKLYAHVVNVTLLAVQVGKRMGYNDLALRDLAVGCMLHDIGKMVAKEELMHPHAGFDLLRSNREVHLLSAHVAFQHHEAWDGSGYPRKLEGDQIHEYAQICSVADKFDHLTSDELMAPHEALEVIMALSGSLLSLKAVDTFVKSVPAYPPGTKVKMHDGRLGIVTKIVHHMQRPHVRMLDTGETVALEEQPSVMIREVVPV